MAFTMRLRAQKLMIFHMLAKETKYSQAVGNENALVRVQMKNRTVGGLAKLIGASTKGFALSDLSKIPGRATCLPGR